MHKRRKGGAEAAQSRRVGGIEVAQRRCTGDTEAVLSRLFRDGAEVACSEVGSLVWRADNLLDRSALEAS